MGNMLATAISIGILLFGIIGTVLIAIFGKKKPGKISAAGVFTGVLFVIAAIVGIFTLFTFLADGGFTLGLNYTIIRIINVVVYTAIAIFAFAKLRPAFMAIPLGIMLVNESFGFIVDLRLLSPWNWRVYDDADLIYYIVNMSSLVAWILSIIAFFIMFLTAFTSMKKRGLGIVAGIFAYLIYSVTAFHEPFTYICYAVNYEFFEVGELLQIMLNNTHFLIVCVGLLTLGITMFKTSPKADKKICKCEEAPMVSEVVQEEAPGVIEESAAEEAVMEPVQETADQDTVEEPVQEEAAEAIQEHIEEETKEPEYVPATHGDTDKVAQDLSAYKKMLDDGLITEADFEAKKKQILGL